MMMLLVAMMKMVMMKMVNDSSRMMQKNVRMNSTCVIYGEDGHIDHGLIGGWMNILKIVGCKKVSFGVSE